MRTTVLLTMTLAASLTARADFSYTSTTKVSGGMMGAGRPNGTVSKHFLKGQKLKIDNGDHVLLLDFDAQTFNSINNQAKTYAVTKFEEISQSLSKADLDVKIDFKETGQRRNVNGYNATEAIMTMDLDSPQARKASMKMQMEMDMWLTREVPGMAELRAFYQRNAGRFPWTALAGGGSPSTQKAMAELQRKLAGMDGVPLLPVG